ncbi:MAG: SpoIIE family protein phosphatase [Bacteroidota bacterium]
MRIGIKLTIAFFLIAFASMLVISLISYNRAKISLEKEAFNKLTAVREMKAVQIEDYFTEISDLIITLAETPNTVRSLKRFKSSFDSINIHLGIDKTSMEKIDRELDAYFNEEYLRRLNRNLGKKATLEQESSSDERTRILQHLYIASNDYPVGEKHKLDFAGDKSGYSSAHKSFHPRMRRYLERFGFYDIFLVDSDGNIVYTVFKEVDFGTSLYTGPFRETNLAQAFREANLASSKNFVKLVDFRTYHPSYNAHASFMACPVFDGEEKIGVLVFQMPIDRINDIMTSKHQWSKVGLGGSGETYIVGEDYTLRNQSRFLIEDSANYFNMIRGIGTPEETIEKMRAFNSSIGLQEVKTPGTIDALNRNSGEKIFPDYRGVPVLSSYKPLKIPGMNWVIMSEIDEAEAFASVHTLRNQVIIAFAAFLVVVISTSIIVSRKMTRPLNILTYDAMELAKGNFDVEINIKRKDEIGVLASSFRKMQISIRNLVEELKHINQNLENKVVERTQEIHRQKEMVEEKNREILDSINYAKRLQGAILPPIEKVKEHLPHSFILFKPKDIISGDFYWMQKVAGFRSGAGRNESGEIILIAAVDCTGHGVPGAMVSVVGANSLDRCVKEFGLRKPADIMDKLNDLVTETFETRDGEVRDGMDMTLCSIDLKQGKLEFAGANNPLWIVRNGAKEIEEIKSDKQPIGKFEFRKPFTNHQLQLSKGDCIYLFSDGYADQFGGPKGKKFKYKTLKELLVNVHEKSMEEQLKALDETFEAWKGDLLQVDDVCVIGIKV